MNYIRGLRKADPGRLLFLAVPEGAYVSFFLKADVSDAIEEFGINLVVYNDLKQAIISWLKV